MLPYDSEWLVCSHRMEQSSQHKYVCKEAHHYPHGPVRGDPNDIVLDHMFGKRDRGDWKGKWEDL